MADKTKEVQSEAGSTLDVESGAAALLGLLSDDLEIQEIDKTRGRSESADEDADEDEADDDEFEDADDADEDESDDADESEDDDDAELDDEDDDSASPTHKVKVDGEEIEVSLDEALAGYQRQRTFTKRMQALADEKKEFQSEKAETAQTRQDYLDRLQVVEAALRGQEPDWAQLKKDKPGQYGDIRAAWQERQDQVRGIEQEIARVRDEQRADFESQRDQLVAAEAEKLEAAIPEWATDPEVARSEKQRIADVAQTTYGFTPKEVGDVVDSRLVLLLRDAMLYQELQTKGKKAQDEVRGKRRKGLTLKPGVSTGKNEKAKSKGNPARKRLRQSGGHSIDAAAAALLDFID